MKTIGERIRQARAQRGLSQADLAAMVGFKGQSAIGNLENRASGRGGYHLPKVAAALRVPLAWLLDGPDSDTVPDLTDGDAQSPARAFEPAPPPFTELDRAIATLRQLPPKALKEAATFLDYLMVKYNAPSSHGADHPVPAPAPKAA